MLYLAAAALLSMAESWNLLEQPMIFLRQKARYPLSVLLSRLPEAEPAQKLFAGLFPAAVTGPFWLALPWRRGRLP